MKAIITYLSVVCWSFTAASSFILSKEKASYTMTEPHLYAAISLFHTSTMKTVWSSQPKILLYCLLCRGIDSETNSFWRIENRVSFIPCVFNLFALSIAFAYWIDWALNWLLDTSTFTSNCSISTAQCRRAVWCCESMPLSYAIYY